MAVILPIFTSTYFQLPFSINVSYVWRVQQHMPSRMCGDLSSNSESTYLGLDSRSKSPILSIGKNTLWVPIKQSGEKIGVYGYWGNQDPPDILDRGTYATAYDIPTSGTIILACHIGLGRKNHGNVLLLPPFVMIKSGWEVRDVSLQNFPKDGNPNQHCLILPTLG